MKRSGPLKRNQPLRKVGRKALREVAALHEFRQKVRANAGGMCQGHTPWCRPGRHEGTDAHHLAPSDRDRGNHDPARGVLLCRSGHAWAHQHPAEAYACGLLLRSDP